MSQIEKQLKEMNIEVEDSTDDLNELNNHSITSDVATYVKLNIFPILLKIPYKKNCPTKIEALFANSRIGQ